jgi:hypothetical protein
MEYPQMSAKLDTAGLAALQPKAKPYKIGLGSGLYLEITPNGSKLWRLKYYFERRERKLALGAFPVVTLAQALQATKQARAKVAKGIDPAAERQAERAEANSKRPNASAFRLSLTLTNALTIETPRQLVRLTPEQTTAVRAFLLATDMEGTSRAAD